MNLDYLSKDMIKKLKRQATKMGGNIAKYMSKGGFLQINNTDNPMEKCTRLEQVLHKSGYPTSQ